MCGLLAFIARNPDHLPSDTTAQSLRDRIQRRGPDSQGLYRSRDNHALLLHRRLAIIDPTPAGHQPMLADDHGTPLPHNASPQQQANARYALVYNGELYNEPQLRRALEAEGHTFHAHSDTETLLRAIIHWGIESTLDHTAPSHIRGMFAFALYDAKTHTLNIARDPLGIKPLYIADTPKGLAIASEPVPILESPWLTPEPNIEMVSAYITTIRTVIDRHTVFKDLESLPPATHATYSLADPAKPTRTDRTYWQGPALDTNETLEAATTRIHDALTDAVTTHLRADVPVCALLSGGLDSTITSTIAKDSHPNLQTFAAGARSEDGELTDLDYAQQVATALGTTHHETVLNQQTFIERWQRNVDDIGLPMMTPNEVAIHAVAETLKAQGCTVTISGEGADELFGGYAGPMTTATLYQRQRIDNPTATHIHPGEFELENVSWVGRQLKPHIMSEHTWERLKNDDFLRALYRTHFERSQQEAGATADAPIDNHLAAHLKFQRSINLAGLLQRLDTATMLASVEGRTPFADAHLAAHAEQTPLPYRFQHQYLEADTNTTPMDDVPELAPEHTKAILRAAFKHRLPHTVLTRKKASFPLPFQTWAAPLVHTTQSSPFLREHCSEPAIATINAEPTQAWNIAWPLINLALWANRWWPDS